MRLKPKTNAFSVAVLAVAASACSADDDALLAMHTTGAEPVEVHSGGALLVEYNPTVGHGVAVSAQFLEVRGVTLNAAFDALDTWLPDDALDVGTCSITDNPTMGSSSDVRLHMLDVGPISIDAVDQAIMLEGRRVPDMQSISGVVYGNEQGFGVDEAFLAYEPATRYQISAPGAEAGAFEVELAAPSIPALESISGQYLVDSAPIDLAGDALAVEWRRDTTGHALFLDISSSARTIHCRLDDDGRFVIPTTVVDQIASPGQSMHLVLRRVDTATLVVHGVDDAVFVFATADEATLIR